MCAACPEVRVYGEQVEGPASVAPVEAAGDAELLVLGSRGLSRITGLLVGSVASASWRRRRGPWPSCRLMRRARTPKAPADGTSPCARTAAAHASPRPATPVRCPPRRREERRAGEQQLRGVAAEGLGEVYFRDGGRRAHGLEAEVPTPSTSGASCEGGRPS
ncbi:universal stress protein [Streptomyces griseomycini]|uniref:universal stress protein n=1 Tax=Streptomyces griseomycini TaxID=66895 RepID=UPI0035714144